MGLRTRRPSCRVAGPPPPCRGWGETASERTGRGSRWLGATSRYAVPVALAGLCLLLLAGLLWLRPGGPPGPAVKALEITEMRVTHFRENGNEVRALGNLRTS